MTDRGRDLDLHGMMDVLWLAETVRDRHGARRPAAGPAFPPAADAAGAAPPDGPGQLDDQGESSFTPPIGTPAPDGELLRQRHGPQLSEAGAGMTAARGTVDDRIGAAGRALRPLRRTVPRPGGEELDEDRTVRVSADADLPVVITRTRTERWLDLALVLDVSPSMGLWRDTVAETTRALERAGVFRDVRVWRLFPGADGALVLHTPAGQRRRPTELLDYSGRRLIAVLTDGIDDRWRRESTVAFLRKWATHNPIVILQPLPPSMWHRTSLPPIPMRARQRVPGIWRHPSPDPRHPVDEGWVPVVGIVPDSLGRWSAALADQDRRHSMPAVPLGLLPLADPGDEVAPTGSPGEQVATFQSLSSATAFTLAGHLAAAPITLPVARAVQSSVLPASDPSHLAEVLLSGLVERVAPAAEPDEDPDAVLYDFVPGVRGELLRTRTRHDAFTVLDVLADRSREVAGPLGTVDLFEIAERPREYLDRFPESRATAETAVTVLGGLGGPYADAARLLDEALTPSEPAPPPNLPRVYISYAADDSSHEYRVRRLQLLLRSVGVDARLDPPPDVPSAHSAWSVEQITAAQLVLVVASPGYRAASESEGRGVMQRESRLLLDRYLAGRESGRSDVMPVVFGDDHLAAGLPAWLLAVQALPIRDFTPAEVEPVLTLLGLGVGGATPPLGPLPALSAMRPGRPPATLVIDARLDGARLTSEVTIDGVVLSRRQAKVQPGVGAVWSHPPAASATAWESLASAGRALAEAVFEPATLRRIGDIVAGSEPGSETEVVWRAAGAALGLPVELLRLVTSAGEELEPLALIAGVSVRREVLSTRPRAARPALPGPLRVLAAVAAPDENRTSAPPLDVEAEVQALLDAVGEFATGDRGQVRVLEVASPTQIAAALAEADFHVLHLSAHGSDRMLLLEDEDGNAVEVGARDLTAILGGAGARVPLIVLMSSNTAAGGENLAVSLVEAGADRVIAFQSALTDRYATQLAAALYRELTTPAPVGRALARARRAVELDRRTEDRPVPAEYGTATLVCAGADTPLIDPTLPPVDLPESRGPAGASAGELDMNQLIGRRAQLREGTAILRRTRSAADRYGVTSGVQLLGVGGIGKTAVAGRLMARLRGDGMIAVRHEGRWNPSALFATLGVALLEHQRDDPTALALSTSDVPDTTKVEIVARLLAGSPVLLVFDGFEQNLNPGGEAFLDPAFDEVFSRWCRAAETGAILVTSRYPVPGDDRRLIPVSLGPLSPAELRRLLLRLPGLRGLTGDDLRLLVRTVGGHPRLIEYVDALLRGRPTRLREVQAKLGQLAAHEGIELRGSRPIGAAVDDALILGGSDIVLDELLALLSDHERDVLLQLSVSRAPMTADDLAFALDEDTPAADLSAEIERLADLSLLAPGSEVHIHPWTAELLERRPDPGRRRRHERALAMRLNRLEQRRVTYDDLIDIARHFAATSRYNEIAHMIEPVGQALPGVVAVAAYLAEIRTLIPRTERAWSAVTFEEAQAVRTAGDLRSARTLLIEVNRAVEQRMADRPDDGQTIVELATVLTDLGDVALEAGDLTMARAHFDAAVDALERRAERDPDDTLWRRNVAVVLNKLGEVATSAGDLATAQERYLAGMDLLVEAAGADPADRGLQRDVAITRYRLSYTAAAIGDFDMATRHGRVALEIMESLTADDPGNPDLNRDLMLFRTLLGDVAMAMGDLNAATDHYRTAVEVAQRLTATDAGNTVWHRDLAMIRGKLGDAAVAAGDVAEARRQYEERIALLGRLSAADPANAQWQRDLSISHNGLGDVALLAGDLEAARAEYTASLDITLRLADADPSNTYWTRDLSILHGRLGDLEATAGDLAGARERYRARLAILQRLVDREPSSVELQRDLSIVHSKLGEIEAASDSGAAVPVRDLASAREHYQVGLAIMQRLIAKDPGNPDLKRLFADTTARMNVLFDR